MSKSEAYYTQLIEYNKKFLIIGNLNAITYKEIFPLLKDNKMWFGATYFNGGAAHFIGNAAIYDPEKMSNSKNAYMKDGKLYWRVNGVRWYTNLDHKKRHEKIILFRKYTPEEYPTYDNYNAIEVSKVADIPCDYDGFMGVPVSFMDKYNPEQFEIIGTSDNGIVPDELKTTDGLSQEFIDNYYKNGGKGAYQCGNPTAGLYENGIAKTIYKRIFIKRK